MNNTCSLLIKKIRHWLGKKVAKSHHKIHFQNLNRRRFLSLNLYIDQCTMFHSTELTMPRITKNGEIWFLRNPGQFALQLWRGGSTGCSCAHCSSQHSLTLNFGFLLPCDGWKVLQWQAPKWDAHDAAVHSIQMAQCALSHSAFLPLLSPTFVSLCVTYHLIPENKGICISSEFPLNLSNRICMSWDLISLISTLASWICRHF